jgi:hypothetical protein
MSYKPGDIVRTMFDEATVVAVEFDDEGREWVWTKSMLNGKFCTHPADYVAPGMEYVRDVEPV